jgi:hypothetical protein
MAKIRNEELGQLTADVLPERLVLQGGLLAGLPLVGSLTQGLPLLGGGGAGGGA